MLTQVAEAHGWKFTVCYLLASSTRASVLPRVLSAPLGFDCVRPRLCFSLPSSRSTFNHMNVLTFIIWSRPRLICGVLALGSLGAAAHLAKRKLDRTCPRVPLAALPKPSACRNVIERTCETAAAPAWGLEKPVIVSSWPGGDDKTHWTPSFAALQVEVPLSVLAGYGPLYGKDDNKHTGTEGDAFCLFHGRPRNGARGVGLG